MAGYIGSKTSVVSSGVERKKTYSITGSTTSLTGLNYTVGKVHVYQNGVRLLDGTDYTATNGTSITLTVAAQSGDNVVVVSQASFQLSEHYTSAEADAEFVTKTGDTMSGDLSFGDNDKAKFGAGSDLQIYHDGSNNHTYIEETGSGSLRIRGENLLLEDSSGKDFLNAVADAQVELSHNGVKKFETTSTGIAVTGNATFADNGKAIFGAGDDLQIFHDGNDSKIIENGNGDLYIGGASNMRFVNSAVNATYAMFTEGGKVQLNYNDSKRFETTDLGIDVTGETSAGSRLVLQNKSTGVEVNSSIRNHTNNYAYMFGGTNGLIFANNTGENTRIKLQDSNEIEFFTSSTNRMVIDSSGNVGIGTANPIGLLSVVDSSTGSGMEFQPEITSNTNRLTNYNRTASAYKNFRLDALQLEFQTSGNERVRITSSGSLTLNPNSSGATYLNLNTGATDDGHIIIQRNGSNKYQITSGTTNALQFYNYTAGGESMRIDSSGRFMVGKSNPTFGNSTTQDGFLIDNNDTFHIQSDGLAGFNVNRRTSTGALVQFWYNTSLKGSISTNGSSTSYNTTSDYRLKENVVDLTGASARVNQLNPSRFNFIADETNTLVDGFLAHEVATVVPEAITGTKDAMKDEEYEVTPAVLDDDGNVTTEAVMGTRSVPDYQGIDQSKLVPLLTAALQEALTEIASLKTRVEALEA